MSNYSDSSFDEANENTSWFKVFSLIPEGAKLLDIGCSSGNFGEVLIRKKNCHVDGIELDKSDAALARKKLGNVWVLNVETDSLDDIDKSGYDVIYFGDVVEHLVHPSQTLERVKPLLKKDGIILFSIPNMGHISVRLDLLRGDFNYTETGLLDKTHLHFYTQSEVVRVFEEAGYHIEKLDFVKKDYPDKLLKQYLAKYGLSANKDFMKKMHQTDASAFQFVGTASPAKKKHHTLATFGPIDMFEGFYNDTVSGYESRIKDMERDLEKTREELHQAEQRLRYKLDHPYRAVGKHIKGKISK